MGLGEREDGGSLRGELDGDFSSTAPSPILSFTSHPCSFCPRSFIQNQAFSISNSDTHIHTHTHTYTQVFVWRRQQCE